MGAFGEGPIMFGFAAGLPGPGGDEPNGFWSVCPGAGTGTGGAVLVHRKYPTRRTTTTRTARAIFPCDSLRSSISTLRTEELIRSVELLSGTPKECRA
jgi:hypothetical protein